MLSTVSAHTIRFDDIIITNVPFLCTFLLCIPSLHRLLRSQREQKTNRNSARIFALHKPLEGQLDYTTQRHQEQQEKMLSGK